MPNTISIREIEIMELISDGYSSRQIADKLFISMETVKSHRKNILFKLKVRNSAQMIRAAFERRLLTVSIY